VKRGISCVGSAPVVLAVLVTWPLLASVARACPMCFNGNGNNQSAFLYGSLFLMIVPVTAIGSLLYWAYRRTKALEAPPAAPPAASEVSPGDGQTRPALRLVRR
jgi:membrane protease YdiL (CAAX protease family)